MKTGRPRLHTPRPERIRHLLNRIFALGRRYEREKVYWHPMDTAGSRLIEMRTQTELLQRRVVQMMEKSK